NAQLYHFRRFVGLASGIGTQDQTTQRVVGLRIGQVAQLAADHHAGNEEVQVLEHRQNHPEDTHEHDQVTHDLTLFDTFDQARTLNVQAHQSATGGVDDGGLIACGRSGRLQVTRNANQLGCRLTLQFEELVLGRLIAEVSAVCEGLEAAHTDHFTNFGSDTVCCKHRYFVTHHFAAHLEFVENGVPQTFEVIDIRQLGCCCQTTHQVDAAFLTRLKDDLSVGQRAAQHTGHVTSDLTGYTEQLTQVALVDLQLVRDFSNASFVRLVLR